MRPAASIVTPSWPSPAVPSASELVTVPVRVALTSLADSWLRISSWPSACANTSAMSSRLRPAGSKRLVEFTVVGEPLHAVPAAQSTVVWKTPCGLISLTTTKPPLNGSADRPSKPSLPIVVPSLTLCTCARVSVVPGAYVKRLSWRTRSSASTNWPPPTDVRPSVSSNAPAASVIESISAPVLLTCTTDVASSPTMNSESVSRL